MHSLRSSVCASLVRGVATRATLAAPLPRPPVARPVQAMTRLFSSSSSSSSSDAAKQAESDPEADDLASPSTANTLRTVFRARAASLAKQQANLAEGERVWRDSPRMRSLKQSSAGGVLRRTRAKVMPGKMEQLLHWAAENLANAYPHEGFRASYVSINEEENVIENVTLWRSMDALNENCNLLAYRRTMADLAQFVETPTVETREVTVEIRGPLPQAAQSREEQDRQKDADAFVQGGRSAVEVLNI